MTTYNASRHEPHRRWEIVAALVLGLLFLALGAPLAMQYEAMQADETVQVEQEAEPKG